MQSYVTGTAATYKTKATSHVDACLISAAGLAVCSWGLSLTWLWMA